MKNVPKSIKTLRELTRRAAADLDEEGLHAELFGDSDRAVIILWASLLDDAIAVLLKSRMRAECHDALLGADKPLSSFSAKIDLALALSLIGDYDAKLLHILREMRNACAHSKTAIGFHTPALANVTKLIANAPGPWGGDELDDSRALRVIFETTCRSLYRGVIPAIDREPR